MAGGFSIGIAADTRAFEKGVKSGIIDPVEDAQDALDDLAKSGDKAGDGLGRGLDDSKRSLDDLGDAGKDAGRDVERGLKDAEQQLDRTGRAGREAGDDLEAGLRGAQQQTNRTADDYKAMTARIEAETARIKAGGSKTFDGASESSRAFRDEAKANLSEVVSSFDGSAQSITDLFQGTLGGVIQDLGPLGLAAGAAAAVGVGFISQAIQQASEDAEELKEKIDAASSDIVSDFLAAYDGGSKLDKGVREWAENSDRYGISLDDLKKKLKGTEVSYGLVAEAIGTQSLPKMKQQKREIQDQIDALDKQANSLNASANGHSALADQYTDESERLGSVNKALDQNIKANEQAERTIRAVAEANGQTVEEYKAAQAAAERAQKATEDFANSMSSTLADAAESTSEALDNSVMDPSKYIAGLEARTKAAQDYQANVRAIGQQLPSDLFDFVREQGPGFSQEIATYLSASPEQQAAIQKQWAIDAQVTADTSELDKATADQSKKKTKGPTSEVKGDTSDLDAKVAKKGAEKPKGPTSQLRVDSKAVDQKVDKLSGEKHTGPTMKLKPDTSAVDDAISRYKGRTFNATVKLSADTSAVTRAINNLSGRHITVVVDQQVGKRVA